MTIHNLILAHASQVIPALMFTVLAVGDCDAGSQEVEETEMTEREEIERVSLLHVAKIVVVALLFGLACVPFVMPWGN